MTFIGHNAPQPKLTKIKMENYIINQQPGKLKIEKNVMTNNHSYKISLRRGTYQTKAHIMSHLVIPVLIQLISYKKYLECR